MSSPFASPARRTATVIGGGPAGLMAAELLATAGFQVDLYEHMASVGRKLLLAGRSGLNLTHTEPIDLFVARFGSATLIADSVRQFPPTALRDWAAALGQSTYVGSSGRIFPTEFRATPLLRAWLARLTELGVQIHVRHRWAGWPVDAVGGVDPRRQQFHTQSGQLVETTSDVTVFALGGASWPRVGSDGGWVSRFEAAGLRVRGLQPANCGVRIEWSRVFSEKYEGVPIKNARVTIGAASARGDIMVTGDGLESGPIYMVSKDVRQAIERDGACTLLIDLHPDLTAGAVADRLSRRRPKDSTHTFLRRSLGLAPVALALLRESSTHDLPSDPTQLAQLVKALPLHVNALASLERAISTAGGLSLDELDQQFMIRSLPGTFVAGEMLDWEAPTGGYLLQASFSTGVAAARGAIDWSPA